MEDPDTPDYDLIVGADELEKYGFDVKIVTPAHDFYILHPFWAYTIFLSLRWVFFALLVLALWRNVVAGSILLFVVWVLWRLKGKDILGIPEISLGFPEKEG